MQVATRTLRDIRSGQRIPSVGTIVKLAAALGVSAPWLAYGIGDATPAPGANCDGMGQRLQTVRRGLTKAALARLVELKAPSLSQNRKRRSVWRRYHRANRRSPRVSLRLARLWRRADGTPTRRRTRSAPATITLAAVSASIPLHLHQRFPIPSPRRRENICRISRLSISPAHPAFGRLELKPIVRRYTDDKSALSRVGNSSKSESKLSGTSKERSSEYRQSTIDHGPSHRLASKREADSRCDPPRSGSSHLQSDSFLQILRTINRPVWGIRLLRVDAHPAVAE